jgi:hypothetical protein
MMRGADNDPFRFLDSVRLYGRDSTASWSIRRWTFLFSPIIPSCWYRPVGSIFYRPFTTAMRRLLKFLLIVVVIVVAIPIAYLLLTFIGMVRQGVGRPVKWEFQPGYRGWVVVRYEDPTCPPLLTKGIFLVIPIPHSGRVCTVSPSVGDAWRYHRYVYVQPDGTQTVISRGAKIRSESWTPVQQGIKFPYQMFFVGTEDEIKKSRASRPEIPEK